MASPPLARVSALSRALLKRLGNNVQFRLPLARLSALARALSKKVRGRRAASPPPR